MANSEFQHEFKIKPIPDEGMEYVRQYFVNLTLKGYTITAPDGAQVTRENVRQLIEMWTGSKIV